jgi:hypothetical protein
MKRRINVRRLEIATIIVIIVAVLAVVVYMEASTKSANDNYVGKPVSQQLYSSLYEASQSPYGASSSSYLAAVWNVGGQALSVSGKPILVSATGEFCSPCALQRWSIVLALMRFGNFTNLEYMTTSAVEGDYTTFAFAASSYRSNYVVFQPYEVYDRAGKAFETLPSNYSAAQQQYGKSSVPFLDFAGRYVISGSILPDPSVLGTKNWTQIVSSIQTGDALGSQIKQAANVITAVICKTTGNQPASVCGQESIAVLAGSLVSYSMPPERLGAESLLVWTVARAISDVPWIRTCASDLIWNKTALMA